MQSSVLAAMAPELSSFEVVENFFVKFAQTEQLMSFNVVRCCPKLFNVVRCCTALSNVVQCCPIMSNVVLCALQLQSPIAKTETPD